MQKEVIKFVTKDKIALSLLIGLGAATVVVTILLLFWLQPSNIQIPIRYSGYDNSLYNDRWYERLSFIGFLLLQTGSAVVLSLLMHARGYKVLAYFLLALALFVTVAIAIVGWAVTQTVTL